LTFIRFTISWLPAAAKQLLIVEEALLTLILRKQRLIQDFLARLQSVNAGFSIQSCFEDCDESHL